MKKEEYKLPEGIEVGSKVNYQRYKNIAFVVEGLNPLQIFSEKLSLTIYVRPANYERITLVKD